MSETPVRIPPGKTSRGTAAACRRVIACVVAAIVLMSPSLVYSQRLQTYVKKYEGRLSSPELGVSGPDAPVNDWDAFFDELRIDIGTNVILPHDKKFYGVTAIAMQETGDEGCKVELYGRLLDPAGSSANILVGIGTLFGCDEQWTNSWRAATLVSQPGTFVRSVRACYQDSPFLELKMKGLMVSPALLMNDARNSADAGNAMY